MGQRLRQVVLCVCAVVLGLLAVARPRGADDVVAATQFSIAFFATLLTGEAVIFALTFSAASSWPSLQAIDSHIAFREWVLVGWFAALFTACGLLGDSRVSATYGALLFLLANIFGIFSFVQLFGLASVGGRNRLLRRTLAEALGQPGGVVRRPARDFENGPVVDAYLSALGQAVTGNDPTAVGNLVDQLVDAEVAPGAARNAIALHIDVLHRLSRAALVSGADPIQVTTCGRALVDSVVRLCRRLPEPAPALGALSRYLAWLANTSLLMSVRGVASNRSARELVAMSTDARLKILRCVDPDPKSATGPDELGTLLPRPLQVLMWSADFAEFHGAHQAGALYGVYEILTGTKFMGNYWDGASILTQLRLALFGDGDAVDNAAADAARRAFGSVEEYDHFWALTSVTALATLRDCRVAHPPELVRPEFTPDRQLLGAYLRTFATHRYFGTAEEARTALLGLISRTAASGSASERVHHGRAGRAYRVPAPQMEPQLRPAAMILAVACRLAPLAPGGDDTELRAFLTALPSVGLRITAGLAARVLPGASEVARTDPVEVVVVGLRVLTLVGSHTGEGT
ncbi:hypothetical protein AB0N99_28085 [Streptomyces sp. NPDC093272]|uniref:hypothetical protein n=1 Tax=unclassified Streptomyces TaxID=2593676 RepID=UPI00341D52CD